MSHTRATPAMLVAIACWWFSTGLGAAETGLEPRMIDQIASAVNKNSPVLLAKFTSKAIDAIGAEGKKLQAPLTSLNAAGDSLEVDGTFELIVKLNLDPPALGQVAAVFKVNSRFQDTEYRRLIALSPPNLSAFPFEVSIKPVIVLAVGPNEKRDILDYRFFGPLEPDDLPHVRELIQVLLDKPIGTRNRAEAEAWLKSRNPALRYLGLVRLRQMGSLATSHFLSALNADQEAAVQRILIELVSFAGSSTNTSPKDLPVELIEFFKNADPKLQLVFFKQLIPLVESNSFGIADVISAGGVLDGALTDLAKNRQSSPEWIEVVAEYKKLKKSLKC